MFWIYKFCIPIYFLGIRIAALFRQDARLWVQGRRHWEQSLDIFNSLAENQNRKRIWIHASSLGEFEQGKELIETLRKNHPELILVLSFFSPSGYEKQKNYKQVDYVCYFPSDIASEINSFIQKLNPALVLFIKYDFWFNALHFLIQRKTPFLFISMILRPNHYLLHPLFKPFLLFIKQSRQLFLQNQETYDLLQLRTFKNMQITGDSRLDRVDRISKENTPIPKMELFLNSNPVFIAGSIWESDLDIISKGIEHAILNSWQIILVPHLTDEVHLLQVESRFPTKTIRYSSLVKKTNYPILIMDQVGFLSSLYKYALFAYVGGGFGKGIHNTLEPVSHRILVCFGPNHFKFPEAQEFIKKGIGIVIHKPEDFVSLVDEVHRLSIEIKASIDDYFSKNLGASQKIYQYLIDEQLIR